MKTKQFNSLRPKILMLRARIDYMSIYGAKTPEIEDLYNRAIKLLERLYDLHVDGFGRCTGLDLELTNANKTMEINYEILPKTKEI